jgi:hypothetical protein
MIPSAPHGTALCGTVRRDATLPDTFCVERDRAMHPFFEAPAK